MKADFEDLEIWKLGMDLADQSLSITERISETKKHYRLIEQLESAACSVPQNIAEGKGRYSKKEFVHFLFIARGSLNEMLTLFILMERRKWIQEEELTSLKQQIYTLGKMINGLIRSIKTSM